MYDGVDAATLAARVGVPRVEAYDSIGSTLDVAHVLGSEGAPAGTLVLADVQTAGRGRLGRSWRSERGRGIWLTLVERPRDRAALDVLSLRIGLAAAAALDAFTDEPIALKWPNDLYVGGKKLAGILIEARWRDEHPEWVAIGFGLNVRPPDDFDAAGLRVGSDRVSVLEALVPALRRAVVATGPLTDAERERFAARDLARGRAITVPVQGTVLGITSDGALAVRTTTGDTTLRAGSLVFAEDA